jgi:hypothetical protein
MTAPTTTINPNKRPATHIPDTLPTPDTTNPAPLTVTEITDHKTLLHKTIYHVNQFRTDHLTAKQLCQHIDSGFTPEHLSRIHPEDEDTPILDIPFQATWKATWISEDTAKSLPNGTSALQNYKTNKHPPKKKTRTPPPTPPHRQCGWLPRHTTYTTHPINPDLDAIPTGTFEITAHPTLTELVLLHGPDGRLISTITKPRLRKLSNIYHPQDTAITFPEALSDVIIRHNTTTYRISLTKEHKLHKQQKTYSTHRIRGTMANSRRLI